MQEVNVKVAVRVRPLLPKERLAGETICLKVVPKTNQLVLGKDRAFTFDHLLTSKVSQEDVYSRCVDDLVSSCFDGYNATVFAYGQTGSGKTYTVGGGNITAQTEAEFGVIPRAIARFFNIIKSLAQREISVKVSYIEIYKEELRDLLDVDASSKDLHIREDDKGNTCIIGATEVECESQDEVMLLLEQGSALRHTASTQMNDHSSRSHSVFTVNIEQRWHDGGDPAVTPSSRSRLRSEDTADEEDEALSAAAGSDMQHFMCAKFHFVDLAGSERAHRTGNVGDRFKESVHINSGLLALGNVISALGDVKKKATHIPYRESKITRLLKDSLGGNARTLMICCISPASSNFDETLNALKYANRAKNIKNKPTVNRDPHSIRFEEMQDEIKALREELHRQRTSIVHTASGTSRLPDDDLRRAVAEAGQIKELEERVIKLQTECSHYRTVADEAYRQLQEIGGRGILTASLDLRLRDWLDLMEEIKNKVPATLNKAAWENQTISVLEEQLAQARSDLASDEEIFAEKAKEASSLLDRVSQLERENSELTSRLEKAEDSLKQQEESTVAKEVQIEELTARVRELEAMDTGASLGNSLSHSGSMQATGLSVSGRRAKSVPVQRLGDRLGPGEEVEARNIHTSPAIISIDRVMQGFRARSQLLISRLEDNDDVLQPPFSDDDVDENDDNDDQDVFDGGKDENTFARNACDRRTYKVAKPRVRVAEPTDAVAKATDDEAVLLRRSVTDDEKLSLTKLTHGGRTFTKLSGGDSQRLEVSHQSGDLQKKRLKQTELDVRQSSQVLRDLSINIKMKEQLIRELVKTSKETSSVNRQYEERIHSLERDKQSAKADLLNLQKALADLEAREQQDKAEKEKLQVEFRRKMEAARTRIHTLQKKQKETEKMAAITGHSDSRISHLESAVDKMKQQQDLLQRRLKEELEQKAKLEREVAREQQRVQELETRAEQQQKVLKVKTQEMSGLHRKLRGVSSGGGGVSLPSDGDGSHLEEQRKWLEEEMEKVLEQRQQMARLEKELALREDIVVKKEAMVQEKSELEIKKLRSSQMMSKDMMSVSAKLASVEQKLEEKTRELQAAGRGSLDPGVVREEISRLREARDKMGRQREQLDRKLHEGAVLSTQEERRLIEIEEGLEALDAAIEYKTESINSQQDQIRQSLRSGHGSTDHVLASRLGGCSPHELRTLLARYFERVIDLRELARQKDHLNSELEMRCDEQDRVISELKASLQRSAMELDRKLTSQQHEYERKMQVLLQQLAKSGGEGGGGSGGGKDVSKLEKELYFYKMKSRELKTKLKEIVAGAVTPGPEDGSGRNGESADMLFTPRDAAAARSPRSAPTSRHQSSGGSSSSHPSSTERSSGGADWDRLAALRDGPTAAAAAPVRISRRELRRMSQDEVLLRKSAAESVPADSLEVGKNPWT